MTPLLWGRAAISVLCAVTALWVAFLMRRRRQTGNTRPEDQTRRVLWILTALAVALFLGIDPLGRQLGGSIGQPFLPDHLKHICGLVAGMNALAAAENIRGTTARYRPPSGTARLRQAWPVVALSLFAFYWASPNRGDLLEMRQGLGG